MVSVLAEHVPFYFQKNFILLCVEVKMENKYLVEEALAISELQVTNLSIANRII